MKTACQKCLEVVAVPTRFTIFSYLQNAEQEIRLSDLVALTKLRQPTVTFHVNALVEQGLVKKIKKGREVLLSASSRCKPCLLFMDDIRAHQKK